MTNEISERVLEALDELKEINNRFFHPYYCRADEVQADYETRIKPVLEPFSSIKIVALAMKKRKEIYREQKREKKSNNNY